MAFVAQEKPVQTVLQTVEHAVETVIAEELKVALPVLQTVEAVHRRVETEAVKELKAAAHALRTADLAGRHRHQPIPLQILRLHGVATGLAAVVKIAPIVRLIVVIVR